MKKFAWGLIFAIAFTCSCHKKEFPASVTETQSEFYFNGTVDGAPILFKAGVDNYCMYSSNTIDTSNIYSFIADLKECNCSNCSKSIQIKINDFKVSAPNAPAQIDLSLSPKSYPFQGVAGYLVQFKSIYTQTAASYLWNFGDNNTSTLADPTHIYSASGNYSISLKVTGTNLCQQYIGNIEKINSSNTNCKITLISDSLNTLKFMANPQGPAPHKYRWNFGDGSKDSSLNVSHTYAIPGTYPVLLRVIDANHDTAYAKYNIATETNPMPCLTNYSITSITPANSTPFSNVTITWTDNNGVVYSSNNLLQPSTSYFKIISVEDYENNEKNEKTKKIKINFRCNVYNGTSFKVIDNAETTVCVSYK